MRRTTKDDVIHSISELEPYGIHTLTGEACGMGMRVLCDLSPEGVKIVEEFLSVQFDGRNNSWNHQDHEDWASIMLPYSIFPELAAFCLAKNGCAWIVYVNYRGNGFSSYYVEGFRRQADFDDWRKMADRIYEGNYRQFYIAGNAKDGTRNQHYMSGRVA